MSRRTRSNLELRGGIGRTEQGAGDRTAASPRRCLRRPTALAWLSATLVWLAGSSACRRAPELTHESLVWQGRTLRPARGEGPGLFLAVGRAPLPSSEAVLLDSGASEHHPWELEPWELREGTEGPGQRIQSSFLIASDGLLAQGPTRLGPPSVIRARLVRDGLEIAENTGEQLALRIPQIVVAMPTGKPGPAVAIAKEIAAPSILLARDGEAIVVEQGTARLDGEAAFVVGKAIRMRIGVAADVMRAHAEAGGEPVVHDGRVEPAVAGVGVTAIGPNGEPLGAAVTDAGGHFRLVARPGVARLFSLLGEGRGSEVVVASPAREVTVPLAPMGHLSVDVRDFDGGRALPVRMFLHGADGTPEPNLGPPFRGSGAGSIVDLEHGRFDSALPAGTYRVLATHGLEWSLDDQTVTIGVGEHRHLALSLRHVVPTPGLAACDFHVHSSAGFDSDVSVEDRVRTLAGVGIDFAAPTEHNVVGDYDAVKSLGLEHTLGWAPAVEVTTDQPARGHFNVFPYPFDEPPPWEHTTLARLVSFVRAKPNGSDMIVQVNHPRLGGGMGYFDLIELDRDTHRSHEPLEPGFDTLEVYNGFDLAKRERAEAVIGEWLSLYDAGRRYVATGNSDSHTAQYSWAGFPRTYAAIDGDLEDAAGPPVAVGEVVRALRRGHATVTSGPLVDVRVGPRGEAGPGDAFPLGAVAPPGAGTSSGVRVRVIVRRPPWIDVREVRLMLRGEVVQRWSLLEQPLETAFVGGPLLRLQDAAVALDAVVELPSALVREGGSLIAVATGERNLSGILPFLEGRPLGFTNPVRLVGAPASGSAKDK